MGRTPEIAGGRPHNVSTRLSERELRVLDRIRGRVAAGPFIRALIAAEDLRQQVAVDPRFRSSHE